VNIDAAILVPVAGYAIAATGALIAFVVKIERRLARIEMKMRMLQLAYTGSHTRRAFLPTTDNAQL